MNRISLTGHVHRAVMLSAALLLWAWPAEAQTTAEKEAATLRASSCSSCHGVDGNSPSDKAPRLNGQNAAYLAARLVSFRYPIKESPRAIHTMGIAGASLSDGVIAALARFYAAQTPPAAGAQANAMGVALYQKGAKDIPACQSCHGANGEGSHGANGEGSRAAPRIAGQHKAYLLAQLSAFSIAARIADPMNHHVWVMTDQQAQAVAAYLGN